MKTLLLCMSLLLSFSALAENVTVKVPGMVCQMCVHGMRKAFKDSVKNAEKDVIVDLDKKIVKLNLSKKLADADIKSRIQDAGYNAESIKRSR